MERNLFEQFYDRIVDKIAEKVVKEHPEFEYTRNLDGVYEEYLNQKTLLHMLLKSSAGDEKDLLDGHKVSACITCAIIKVRVITCKKVEDSADKPYSLTESFRLNEQIALLSGLSCLLAFMKDNPERLYLDGVGTTDFQLILPKTFYSERASYLDSLIRALYYSNLFACVNPLLLAHIFFLIEANHRNEIELAELRKRDK